MSREIKIEGSGERFCEQIKRKNTTDVATEQIPVGENFDGVEIVKQQTDKDETLGEYILRRYQEECKRDEIKHEYDDALLTPKEERKVADILDRKPEEEKTEMSPYAKERYKRLEDFIGKRLNKEDIIEISEKLDELAKEYVPEENIDKAYKVNDVELIEKARKLYTLGGLKYCGSHKECQEMEVCNDKCNLDKAMTFDRICHEIMDLHAKKNKDYGNAADASYREFGITSYVIRLNDKMNRLKSLTKPGTTLEVKDESIEDTLMDLAAYAIMAIESMRT